jgi:hypothetical protein
MSASKAENLSVDVIGKTIETRFFTEKDRGALREIYFESRINAFTWLDNSLFNKNCYGRKLSRGFYFGLGTGKFHP